MTDLVAVDVTTSVMVRVQVLTADDGLTPSTVSLTGDHHLMHVNLVRWSHPTEPPDKLWYTAIHTQ